MDSREKKTAPGALPPSAVSPPESRRRIGIAAAGLVVLVLLILIIHGISKKSLTSEAAETTMGLAQRYYQEGKYADALAEYRLIESSSSGLYPIELQMGNTYFKLGEFAEAEACYRKATKRDSQTPRPFWNLATTLYAQHRLSEATAAYGQIVSTFGGTYPDLAERAKLAQSLIEEQRQARSTISR